MFFPVVFNQIQYLRWCGTGTNSIVVAQKSNIMLLQTLSLNLWAVRINLNLDQCQPICWPAQWSDLGFTSILMFFLHQSAFGEHLTQCLWLLKLLLNFSRVRHFGSAGNWHNYHDPHKWCIPSANPCHSLHVNWTVQCKFTTTSEFKDGTIFHAVCFQTFKFEFHSFHITALPMPVFPSEKERIRLRNNINRVSLIKGLH